MQFSRAQTARLHAINQPRNLLRLRAACLPPRTPCASSSRVSYFPPQAAVIFAAIVISNVTAQTPYSGVRARSAPADYAVSQQTAHATYAAALVPADQVKQLFALDISKKYLVFEVAVYPVKTGAASISPGDFLAQSGSHADFVCPVNAAAIAAAMGDRNSSPHLPDRVGNVNTEVGVGYETGTDPYTGRRVHGTYTEVGVNNYPNPQPSSPPRPGSSPQNRINLEDELSDRSLPAGTFTPPTAGYLYFAASELKKVNGAYELQFLNDDSGKVSLFTPTKKK